MTTRISIEDVANEVYTSELARYTEYGIPVGTYVPDSELAPSRATSRVILRHRRLVFFTFDELGNPRWEPRELNYLGESIREICPGVNFTARNCRQNRNTDLFVEFRDLKDEAFERAAFKYLAKKHQLNEDWNWPTYNIMRAEPYRRSLRQIQINRLEQGNYSVPTFKRNGMDDVQRRQAFMNRLEGIMDWEMDNKYLIGTRWDTKSLEYSQERFLLASRTVDLVQKLLHDTQNACASDLNCSPYIPPSPRRPGDLEQTPNSIVSPFTVPNAPFSTLVGDQQPASTSTLNRTIRRVSGMDFTTRDSAQPLQQTTEVPQPNQGSPTRAFDFGAGAQTGNNPWFGQPSASPYHPQLSPGGRTIITPWQSSPGFSECSTNILMPDAAIDPRLLENHLSPSDNLRVSSMVIPIDERQRIRIDVSREVVSPLDSIYPDPPLR